MTGFTPEEERELLAAEHALGVLEGSELGEARRLALADPDFARAVAAWQERLAPLAEEVPDMEPEPHLWQRIERALDEGPAMAANVVPLRRKLNVWRGYAAAVTAVAAALAFVVYKGAGDPPVVVQKERAPVMVAALSSQESAVSLSVAYDREEASLLVTPGPLRAPPGRAHQLWIIPSGGTPVSLGLV
ncbi:MAG: anti-sigma factor, partial [Pseudomonadota bacterium]|nr:anti-sigma factor [Pseudomonadota bacterium]